MTDSIVTFREKHDGELGDAALDSETREAVRLWLRLLSCTMVIEKRVRRGLAEQFQTTLPRFDILAALDRAEQGLSMGALGRALLVSNGNITGLVQTLVRDGDVRLSNAPGDRRTAIVQLTPEGRERFRAMAATHHGWIAELLGGLTGPDRAALLKQLGGLQASIAAAGTEFDQ
ncbi:MarR family transcriptional regulator [Polymorphobacter multimanifer]|uniref:DNA-binding MarR family transcriptional regulator n=1 Tax=Polymorphobacter multimanifer TaxID=1070431 RepID=A0A841L8J2_9SPHN|nr:MarR family transcriptional regulator [Polymorphobacter multimanifer]MBB6227901.1 DNA-binding MarR family transcriptional regulator [Polymorphobacter multimanifer]GGI83648.1 MarR family transcriptional regulator [Polymorphobacter multimanifer]